jgi:isopenicillin-N epimerase
MLTPTELRRDFTLDPAVHFLNHGSFGATPRPVARAAARHRARMERQPVRFYQQEWPPLRAAALAELGAHVGAAQQDLAFVPNATFGVNLIARSLIARLRPGDEILTTDHEYGACSNAWEYACARSGARYVRQTVPLPDEPGGHDAAALAAAIWRGVNDRTRVLYISHITSPTALRLPVEALARRARNQGILTVVDGAHAPGQIDLDMEELGVDVYTGNCHKWLCAPKGSGFLFVRRAQQTWVEPLVVSWGSAPERQFWSDSDYQDALGWSGTNDFSAYLAVPDAIRYQTRREWSAVRRRCAQMLDRWLPRLAAATGAHDVYANAPEQRPPQMAIVPLPADTDAAALKIRLHDHYRIEIPVTAWRDRRFVRVSVQGYTADDDLAALEVALCAEAGRAATRTPRRA